MGKQRKLEIGNKIDRLTVIEYLGVRSHGSKRLRFYLCECECKNRIELPGTYIGRVYKSCGCLQSKARENPIPPGTEFERLEVVERTEQKSRNCYIYRCNCSCGTKDVMVRSDMLRSGEVKSCGCIHDELFQKNVKTAYANNFVENTSIPKLKANKPQSNNTSGVPGVSWHKYIKKWYARISFQKKFYSLGYYDSIKDAETARNIAKKELHGNFLEWHKVNYGLEDKNALI